MSALPVVNTPLAAKHSAVFELANVGKNHVIPISSNIIKYLRGHQERKKKQDLQYGFVCRVLKNPMVSSHLPIKRQTPMGQTEIICLVTYIP